MAPKNAKAAAAADGSDGRKQPTPQEAYLFYTIIKNMKGRPDIDWASVAVDNNFKNAETAKVCSALFRVRVTQSQIPDTDIIFLFLPKVRFGQIRRKLGLDNWTAATPSKATKDANDENTASAGEEGFAVPDTPTPVRTKKTGTAGTGAGVKKRAANTNKRAANPASGGRGRKAAQAKSNVKDENEEEEDDMVMLDSPNPENAIGAKIKSELNGAAGLDNVFATFPKQIPAMVLQRQAILVNQDGGWVVTPIARTAHNDWLARLPANIQAEFYSQARSLDIAISNTNNNTNANISADNDDEAAIQAQLIQESLQAPLQHNANGLNAMLPSFSDMDLPVNAGARLGYVHSGNNNHGAAQNQQHVDLYSVPMHPVYAARLQQEREQAEREQEKRDREMLFGGCGHGGGDDGHGWV